MIIFGIVLVIGFSYAGSHLLGDLSTMHSESALPYILLGIALLVALGFEFVNGFHDTANAVATVIYTHSLEPHVAVVWSGFWNFLGVWFLGMVAFGIISLLPVELILQVGSGRIRHGVRAAGRRDHLELGTWYFGLAGIQFAHPDRIDHRRRHREPDDAGTPAQRRGLGPSANVGKSLLISPLVGFGVAALLLFVGKALIKDPKLYRRPKATSRRRSGFAACWC